MERGILVVQTQPKPGFEDQYNQWYDDEHLRDMMAQAGVRSARRFHKRELLVDPPQSHGMADYLVIYEIEAEDLAAAHQAFFEDLDGRGIRKGEHVDYPVTQQVFVEVARRADGDAETTRSS